MHRWLSGTLSRCFVFYTLGSHFWPDGFLDNFPSFLCFFMFLLEWPLYQNLACRLGKTYIRKNRLDKVLSFRLMHILQKCHFSNWKINIFAFFQHFCFFCVIRIITLTKAGVRILKKRHFSYWKINIFGPEPSKSASLSQLGPPRGSNGPPNPHLCDQKSHIELPSRSVQIGSIATIAY